MQRALRKKRLLLVIMTICLALVSIRCDNQTLDSSLDEVELMALSKEIATLSASVDCTDSSDWSISALGSKACGGPEGYVAYSNKIDTAAFLDKVKKFTNGQKLYNEKNGVVSDCAVVVEPIGLVCRDNKAHLIYDRCELIPDSGLCEAAITIYYFNHEEQKCKEFIWGGCDGVVPFDTLVECQECE